MSRSDDLWCSFVDNLDQRASYALARSQANDAALHIAVERGWRVEDVARFCNGAIGATASNPAAIVAKRLREAAGRNAISKGGGQKDGPKSKLKGHQLPWCGRCSDERCRWRTDSDLGLRCECWSPLIEEVA